MLALTLHTKGMLRPAGGAQQICTVHSPQPVPGALAQAGCSEAARWPCRLGQMAAQRPTYVQSFAHIDMAVPGMHTERALCPPSPLADAGPSDC